MIHRRFQSFERSHLKCQARRATAMQAIHYLWSQIDIKSIAKFKIILWQRQLVQFCHVRKKKTISLKFLCCKVKIDFPLCSQELGHEEHCCIYFVQKHKIKRIKIVCLCLVSETPLWSSSKFVRNPAYHPITRTRRLCRTIQDRLCLFIGNR